VSTIDWDTGLSMIVLDCDNCDVQICSPRKSLANARLWEGFVGHY
jgi:hypothetical protein